MTTVLKRLRKKVNRVRNRAIKAIEGAHNKLYNGKALRDYRGDPEGYGKYVLNGVVLTPDQLELVKRLDAGERRIFCRSGHLTGKSFFLAFLVSYLYDTYEEVLIITTAPRLASVRDILWRELRGLRRRAGLGGFTGPRSIRLESGPHHLAYGTTARNQSALQGGHDVRVFIIIDEAVGVEPDFWEAMETMLSGEEFALIATYNPTTTACQAYTEESNEESYIHTINCLNHPNIAEELRGEKPRLKGAVRLEWVASHIKKWCDPILPEEKLRPADFQFPPSDTPKEICRLIKMQPGQWWRPGPIAEARILGRWPTSSVNTFWSEALFDKCVNNRMQIKPSWPVAIGCDVARYGDDMTEIMIRQGLCVLHHEAHSGWDGAMIAGRLKQLANIYHGPQDPKEVRIYIDETGGWGTGTIDNAGVGESEYNFIGINSSSKEGVDKELHYNVRTALWATTVEIAREPGIDLSRLSKESRAELKKQCMAQKFRILPTSALQAIDKDKIKEELGRSPDTADSLNLCFFQQVD